MSAARKHDPQVICRMCKYHYGRSTMIATDRGYHCADRVRCCGNIAVRERMARR